LDVKYGSVANRALELLGKHIGLFPDKVEVTGKDGGPVENIVTVKDRLAPYGRLLRDLESEEATPAGTDRDVRSNGAL
jgi:hypothetical protein